MSWTGNHIATSFKKQLLEMKHDFRVGGHTFFLALYTEDAVLTAGTANYSTANEVVGTGYTAGGAQLTQVSPVISATSAFADFADLVFSTVTLTGDNAAFGGIIYNKTTGGGSGTTDAVAILDFGGGQFRTAANLTVVFPTADSLNAIVLIK
tara:strand:- start:1122 stop:1577 length:456 start_codon:yes stop_codon:yes gene_type:complete